jgi:RHS repeat-associated protein
MITRTLDTTAVEYDGSSRVSRIYDPFRATTSGTHLYTTLTYGFSGLSSIQEPGPNQTQAGGRTTSVGANLTSWTDPGGGSTQFGYDGSGRLNTVTDRNGKVTTINYGAATWKLASTVSPLFAVDPNVYGAGQQMQQTVSYRPWQTAAVPATLTNLSVLNPVLSDTLRGAITDPGAHMTAFTANRWGQSVVITELPGAANARVTTITRPPLSIFASSIQHPEGPVDQFQYSGPFLTYEQRAGQRGVNTAYTKFAQPDSVWGAGRPKQVFALGPRGRVNSVTVAGISTTTYAYDSRQRVESVMDPGGHSTVFIYEPVFGNQDSTLAPGARATKLKFDQFGRDTASRAGSLPWNITVYDALNRVKKSILASAQPDTVVTSYDSLYVTQVRDPAGNTHTYTTNAIGLVTQRSDPWNNPLKYFYDAEGNLTSWTNRRNQTVRRSYDGLHRVLTKTGTGVVGDTITYSNDGRSITARNATSIITTISDGVTGWVNSTQTRFKTDTTKSFQVNYLPDSLQRLDSVYMTAPSGIALSGRRYVWNTTTGTLDQIRIAGAAVTMAYNNNELLRSSVTQPGGVTRTESMTSLHDRFRLSFGASTGVDTLLWRASQYDAFDRIVQQYAYAQSSKNKTQYVYKYDDHGRLVATHDSTLTYQSACQEQSGPDFGARLCVGYTALLNFKDSLSYDRLGNITYTSGSAGTGTPTYDKTRLLTWPGYTFTKDADGNITQKHNSATGTNTNYFWSPESRLDSVKVDSASVLLRVIRYDFDPAGQLARKRVGNVASRHFLWDGGQLLVELDSTLTKRIAEYVHDSGVDRPLAIVTDSAGVTITAYFQQDLLGSVIGLVRSNGEVDGANILAEPWGQRTAEFWTNGAASDGPMRLRFKGMFYDGDLPQLYYARSRWYDPQMHRFLSEDPIGLGGGINPYTFADGDPVNKADPTGLAVDSGDDCWTENRDGVTTLVCRRMTGGSVDVWSARNGPGTWSTAQNAGGVLFGGPGLFPTDGGFCGYACAKGAGPVPPAAASNDRISRLMECTGEHFGLYSGVGAVGTTAIALGQPTIAKRFASTAIPGNRAASKMTSVASSYLSRKLPIELPFKVWAPTFNSLGAGTTNLGRVLGRWTPIVGYGLLAADGVMIGRCAAK